MKRPKELLRVAAEWRRKADEDLLAAVSLLKLRKRALAAAVCFHAQQVVEKYIKACLVLNRVGFRRTHDIGELIALLPMDSVPHITTDEQEQLSEYAVVTRYPGEGGVVSLSEAEEAVGVARRVRRQLRRKLADAGE